jgi:hypothetical protein
MQISQEKIKDFSFVQRDFPNWTNSPESLLFLSTKMQNVETPHRSFLPLPQRRNRRDDAP